MVFCYSDYPGIATQILVCRGNALGPVVARFPFTAKGMAMAKRFLANHAN